MRSLVTGEPPVKLAWSHNESDEIVSRVRAEAPVGFVPVVDVLD